MKTISIERVLVQELMCPSNTVCLRKFMKSGVNEN